MKQFIAILLTGMMIFTLASCGKKPQDKLLKCCKNGKKNREIKAKLQMDY